MSNTKNYFLLFLLLIATCLSSYIVLKENIFYEEVYKVDSMAVKKWLISASVDNVQNNTPDFVISKTAIREGISLVFGFNNNVRYINDGDTYERYINQTIKTIQKSNLTDIKVDIKNFIDKIKSLQNSVNNSDKDISYKIIVPRSYLDILKILTISDNPIHLKNILYDNKNFVKFIEKLWELFNVHVNNIEKYSEILR